MTAARSLLLLFVVLLLAGCSKSPAVTLSAEPNGEYRQPDNLGELLTGELQRAIFACYRDSKSEAVGATVLRIRGSHGILDVETEAASGDATLDACAKDTVLGARMARTIGDTDDLIGFVLTVNYAQE